MKLFTCGRHFNTDVFIAAHGLKNLYSPMRA